jgi:hypothetical protein
MHCKLMAASIAAALSLSAHAQEAAPATELLTARVEGELTVGVDGSIETYTIHTALPDALLEVVQKAIASWQFDPPSVEGRPVRARSHMHLSLVAAPEGEHFSTRVDNVVFHDNPKPGAKKPASRFLQRSTPPYPPFQVEGVVTVALRIGADGRVLDADATQCSIFAIEGRTDKARACTMLGERAARAARKWVADTAGHPEAQAGEWLATLPFHFHWGQQKLSVPAGKWRREYRTAYVAPAWQSEFADVQRVGTADVVDERLVEQRDTALHVHVRDIGGMNH